MRPNLFRILLLAAATALAPAAAAETRSAAALLDSNARDTRGADAGRIAELIVDVASQRVLYVLLERDGAFTTLPVRALGADGRVDLGAAEKSARWQDDRSRFRRATALLGSVLAASAGEPPVAKIRDIRFAAPGGEIEAVIVATPQAEFRAGADLLSARRDPVDGTVDARGYRFEPSDERTRLHDHRWEGQWGHERR